MELSNKGKTMRTFWTQCKHCGNRQKYITKDSPVNKIKTCVFCGKKYSIHKSPKNSSIIKEL